MRKTAKWLYAIFAWIFVLGVVVQVFLAGMVVVARQTTWGTHVSLGHGLGLPLILMLISMYIGRIQGFMKRGTWMLFVVYLVQADFVIFLRDSVPMASALHPVLALLEFALGWSLARRSIELVQQSAVPANRSMESGELAAD